MLEEKQVIIDQDIDQDLTIAVADEPLPQISSQEAPAEQAVDATSLEDVVRTIPMLLAEMQGLRQDFDTKVKYDESKERLIDSLHGELQTYREGLHFKILRPVLIDLIAMYDDLAKVIDVLLTREEGQEVQIQTLRSFQETVEEILSRNGVTTFEVEEDGFLGSKQRVQKMVMTQDPALDKHVARRVRKGFAYENRILRLEIVEVYKYVPVAV
jgi:molecular chaperone GrpE